MSGVFQYDEECKTVYEDKCSTQYITVDEQVKRQTDWLLYLLMNLSNLNIIVIKDRSLSQVFKVCRNVKNSFMSDIGRYSALRQSVDTVVQLRSVSINFLGAIVKKQFK